MADGMGQGSTTIGSEKAKGESEMNEAYGRSEWLLRAALREDRGGQPKIARALRQMAEDARPLEPSGDALMVDDSKHPFGH